MTRRKQLEQRKAINRAIAAKDRANRCPYCKAALPAKPVLLWPQNVSYCSQECIDAEIDVQRALAAMREAR